jgi:anti-sigma regulatory factor (Ser/Thr protein kinase)
MGSYATQQLRSVGMTAPFETPRADVKLTLPALAENVAVVRHVLGAFAESLRLPDELIEDLRLAVTEACTNVVRHAYGDGEPGAVEISIEPREERVRVVVADTGRGIGTSSDTSGPGLGLPLIAAIADTVDLQSAPGGGSRVAMTFARRGERDPGPVA